MYRILVLLACVVSYNAAQSFLEDLQDIFQINNNEGSVAEPLVLTISSNVWSLLDKKQYEINNTMRSIYIPGFKGAIEALQFEVSDVRIESYSFSSSGISFEKYDDTIRLKIGIQFRASAKLEIGLASDNCLLFCLPSPTLRGGIKISSKNVELRASLVWKDFKVTPNVSMDSNIRVRFTKNLKFLNLLSALVDIKALLKEEIAKLINENVVKKLDGAVDSLGNSQLQQLKEKLMSSSYKFLFRSPVEWTVQNNNLQITVKSAGANTKNAIARPIVPSDKMVCLSADIVQIFLPLFTAAYSSRIKREAAVDLVFACVNPELKCGKTSCEICTNFDFIPTSDIDKYHNCIPKFDYKEWLMKFFGIQGIAENKNEVARWFGNKAFDFIGELLFE